MPTLLQINVDANNGSNGGVARDIGRLVQEKGWNSYIAYSRRVSPCTSTLIKIGNKLDIITHVFFSRILDNHGLCSVLATKRLIKKILKIQPDIIHLHNIHGYFLNYKILFNYLKKSRIPVVWTLHDCWPYTGHCSHFISADCYKWKTGCYNCPLKKKYPKSLIFDFSERNYRIKKECFTSLERMTITTVSHWMGRQLDDSFLNKYKIHVVLNGVDTSVFKYKESDVRKKYNINAKYLLLGVAANWSKGKGLYDYYELSKHLDDDFKIVLIGMTPEQISELPNGIIGIKRTENLEELVRFYSASDIILNLSYAESFGLTTVEGMACGTPGIVYDNTASPELLSPETGIVVPTGNIEAVINAIQHITSKGRNVYSAACRKRVLEFFDKDKKYLEYYNIYKQIIDNNQ